MLIGVENAAVAATGSSAILAGQQHELGTLSAKGNELAGCANDSVPDRPGSYD